jgi:hypothetical protein
VTSFPAVSKHIPEHCGFTSTGDILNCNCVLGSRLTIKYSQVGELKFLMRIINGNANINL